ncbi:MAG TPA: hypothetical protein VFF15_03985 [Flavobacteriaceae bacterium]|nr:hypothetical protein [Flavobacteriaceae bacterium]
MLPKKQASGFQVPKDYFSSLEDNVLTKITLTQFPKKSGFTTPEDYFSTINSKDFIIKNNSKPKVIKLANWKTISIATAVAAMLLVFFGLKNQMNPITIENVETVQLENYIFNTPFDIEELATMLEEDTFLTDNFSSFNVDNLEDYLLENTSIENLISE